METLGDRFKKIRLEKGLSLEEVHRQTKIHLNILNAIEEDRLVNFNEVYIRGFLKIYCKFLGLEPKDFVPDYKEVRSRADIDIGGKDARLLRKIKAPDINFEILKPVLGKIKAFIIIILVLLAMVFIFKIGKFIFSKINSSFKKPAAVTNFVTKQENKPASGKQGKIQKEAAISEIRLGIRAKEDCWLQVKADGKTVFQNILRKGRYDSWKANEKIQFSAGNSQAVVIEVNNRIIPSLGRRGQALKNVLVTKDGLISTK